MPQHIHPEPISEAVTALLVCGDELYMARRQPALGVFPGYQAFPGGKVDDEDADGRDPAAALGSHPATLLRALIRELREEVGFDLIAAAEAGQLNDVKRVARALTPPGSGRRRLDTHFFLIRLRSKPSFTLDTRELVEGHWARRADWLARYVDGDLLLAPPTLIVLHEIADYANPGFVDCNTLRGPMDPQMFEVVHQVRMILVPSHTLPPATHTNSFLIGDASSRRVLVDPSPKSREEMDKLLARIAHLGFDEVFLTHHHPDHRQFAEDIARSAGVPIGMSADTAARIQRRQPRIFDGLTVNTYGEGEVLTHWLGRPVRTLAVPGHDEGHLALMPDDRAWCIVGDLIQGVGTVVVGGAEGDMRKYFASLERIIALAPKVIYPSHGSALGGVHYLEKTLDHRRQREAQIKVLHDAGVPAHEMTAQIYANVDPRLLPLAKVNIDSHLAKLRAEGVIN